MQKYSLDLDYFSLLSLHRALLEAKFHPAPEDESVSGSPLVANISIQVRDLLIASEQGSQWRDWFQLSNRPDRKKQAVLLMKHCKRWKKRPLMKSARSPAAIYLPLFLMMKNWSMSLRRWIAAFETTLAVDRAPWFYGCPLISQRTRREPCPR